MCLIDTYDILRSGLTNYLSVASCLIDLGYNPIGVRIDSGNLALYSM